jgi:hypothetical protein
VNSTTCSPFYSSVSDRISGQKVYKYFLAIILLFQFYEINWAGILQMTPGADVMILKYFCRIKMETNDAFFTINS